MIDAIRNMLVKHGDKNKVIGFYDQSWIRQIIGSISKTEYEVIINRLDLEINAVKSKEHNDKKIQRENKKLEKAGIEPVPVKKKDEHLISIVEKKKKRSPNLSLIKAGFSYDNTKIVKSVLLVDKNWLVIEFSIVRHEGEIKLVRNVLYRESFGLNAFMHFKPFPKTKPNLKIANRLFGIYVRKKMRKGLIHCIENWDGRHLIRNAPIDPRYLGLK